MSFHNLELAGRVILPEQVHAVNREVSHVLGYLERHMAQIILFVINHRLYLRVSPSVIFDSG